MLTGLLGYASCAPAANGSATSSAASNLFIMRSMLDLPFAERQGRPRARLPRSRPPRDARSLGARERARSAKRSRAGDAALLAALPAAQRHGFRHSGLRRRRQRRAAAWIWHRSRRLPRESEAPG